MPTLSRPLPSPRLALGAVLLGAWLVPLPASAQGFGLSAPPADAVWPRWRARVTVVQTGGPSLTSGLGHATPAAGDAAPAGRQPFGGALLGDYHFAALGFGSLRASGGVRIGPQGGMPLALGQMAGAPRLAWSVLDGGVAALPGAAGDGVGSATLPYLGLGFSGALWGNLSLSADLGYVAERSSTAGIGRALLGNQGIERSLRELRLSPLLQVGLRYAF